jgi:hypothetical protein
MKLDRFLSEKSSSLLLEDHDEWDVIKPFHFQRPNGNLNVTADDALTITRTYYDCMLKSIVMTYGFVSSACV